MPPVWIPFQHQEDQTADTITAQAVKKAPTPSPLPKKFSLNEKEKEPPPHGHPHQFLASRKFEVSDPDTKKVVGSFVMQQKPFSQNVAYMSDNERYRLVKFIGMSCLDAIHDNLDIPPIDSPAHVSIIQVQKFYLSTQDGSH